MLEAGGFMILFDHEILSKQYKLKNIQRIDPLFDTFSEYSSTKNPSLEEWILADNFSEIFVKIVNNHNFLVNKSY